MTYLKKNDKIWYMKENTNIILTFLPDGISRITLNDPSNYNALSSKNIKSLIDIFKSLNNCLLYTSPSPRDGLLSRMPSSA